MQTSVPAEDFLKFQDYFKLQTVMPVLIERFGTKLAQDVEREVYAGMKGESKPRAVVYPSF